MIRWSMWATTPRTGTCSRLIRMEPTYSNSPLTTDSTALQRCAIKGRQLSMTAIQTGALTCGHSTDRQGTLRRCPIQTAALRLIARQTVTLSFIGHSPKVSLHTHSKFPCQAAHRFGFLIASLAARHFFHLTGNTSSLQLLLKTVVSVAFSYPPVLESSSRK